MAVIKKHLIVSGRVQGVGFRAFVLRNAKKLGIKGWVKNTYNGDVEAVICGNKTAIDQMLSQIRKGPRWASVDRIKVISNNTEEEFDQFKIRS